MSHSEKLRNLTENILDLLCDIEKFPDELFPLLVLIKKDDEDGDPEYLKCQLLSIEPHTGKCILKLNDGYNNDPEERQLSHISPESLAILLDRYQEITRHYPKKETINSRIEELVNEAFLMPTFFLTAINHLHYTVQQSSDEQITQLFSSIMHASSIRKGINKIHHQLNFLDENPNNPVPYTPFQPWAFLYPSYKEYMELTDQELIRQWESQAPDTGQIERLTLADYNKKLNDPAFASGYYRARILIV